MSSTYSPDLRIELIGTGDQAGVWGNTTNTNLSTVLESAIAGYTSVSVISSSQAFTASYGVADQARYASIALTTTTGANFAVYAPPSPKLYVIYNASSYVATIYNSTVLGNTTAAGTGVAIPAGKVMTIWTDGTNFKQQNTHLISPTLASPTMTTPALGTPASGDFSSGTFTWPTFNQNTSGSAASATNATYATSAGSATNATSATYATSAGSATNATYATSAGSATNATYATSAGSATNAGNGGVTSVNTKTGGVQSVITRGTRTDLTGLTTTSFTVPTWVNRILVMLEGVQTNGSSYVIIRLGTAGGIESSGYVGSTNNINIVASTWSNGCIAVQPSGEYWNGQMTLGHVGGNEWSAMGVFMPSAATRSILAAGYKPLSGGVITTVQVTTVNGTDVFNSGVVNIQYE